MAQPKRSTAESSLVVTVFGTTTGLELLSRPPDLLDNEDWCSDWIELTSDELNLLWPRDLHQRDVYVVHRRMWNGKLLTWIGAYWRTQDLHRRDGFYGCGLWLFGRNADANLLPQYLRSMAGVVEREAMSGGSFQRRLKEVRESIDVTNPALASIYQGSTPASGGSDLLRGDTLYVDASDIQREGISLPWLLNWAQDGGAVFGHERAVIITSTQDGRLANSPLRATTPTELRRAHTVRTDAQGVAGGVGQQDAPHRLQGDDSAFLRGQLHSVHLTITDILAHLGGIVAESSRERFSQRRPENPSETGGAVPDKSLPAVLPRQQRQTDS